MCGSAQHRIDIARPVLTSHGAERSYQFTAPAMGAAAGLEWTNDGLLHLHNA